MKICGKCKWPERDRLGDWVCVNEDSERCTDYINYTDSCDEWEAKN